MKKVNEKAFGFNMTILKILGLYPYNSCPKIYHVYAYSFYVIFTLPIPILSFANILIDRENNMQIFTENFFMVIEISTLMVKLLPFKNHPERIQRTLWWLNEDIFSTRLEKHGNMLEDSIRLGRKLSHTFFVVCVANVFLWALKALLSTERVLMLDVWVPFDVLKHNMLYWGTFLLVFLGVMNAAVGNAIIDTLIAGLIYQGATQLRILKDTLENLGQLTDDEVSEKKKNTDAERDNLRAQILYKKICRCVDHYDAINEYVKDLETAYSFVVFSQFIASIIVICISLLQLSIVEPFSTMFLLTVHFTCTILTEIFLYCYYGTELYEESNSVINSIYMSDWYNFDDKSKKALLTLMERAKRPMKMTAGKLLDLSLDTFATIIRRSYSLLAVLQNYEIN